MRGFPHSRLPELSHGTQASTPGASKTFQPQRCGLISISVIVRVLSVGCIAWLGALGITRRSKFFVSASCLLDVTRIRGHLAIYFLPVEGQALNGRMARIVPNPSAFGKRNDSRVTLSSSRNAVSFSSARSTAHGENRSPSYAHAAKVD
jgi:hypothetical protein